jgi:hypothetical protein
MIIVIMEFGISRAEAFTGSTDDLNLHRPMIGFTVSVDNDELVWTGLSVTMICNSSSIQLPCIRQIVPKG